MAFQPFAGLDFVAEYLVLQLVCHLRLLSLLLDAAHTVADKDERFGQPVVPNGIPLSKIHHAAFDAHLVGIDADYRLHVSERLLGQNDGPMLDALKRLDGGTIHLPNRDKDRPDRDRLALRFTL